MNLTAEELRELARMHNSNDGAWDRKDCERYAELRGRVGNFHDELTVLAKVMDERDKLRERVAELERKLEKRAPSVRETLMKHGLDTSVMANGDEIDRLSR